MNSLKMIDSERLTELRRRVRALVVSNTNSMTHHTLAERCESIGIAHMPKSAEEGSKAERIETAINALTDDDLLVVANRLTQLDIHGQSLRVCPADRNAIQDLLWRESQYPEISKRARRDIAKAIDNTELYLDATKFDSLLESLWVLDDDDLDWISPFATSASLRARIKRHIHNNPGDWATGQLFEEIGALDSSNHRFALFLEGLASADVRPDEPSQRRFVECVNTALASCGAELRETNQHDGYPCFTLVPLGGTTPGRPKNLIFAAPTKPDIRFRDAVDNNIEIASGAENVLVYDRPIGKEGLTWGSLQDWWADLQSEPNEHSAKQSLYRRLHSSLPESSPPQQHLFKHYFKCFGSDIPRLPALLPEVWLHWDPKTVQERGKEALLRFRMDFLLLLPHGHRIVIEVDGKHHYANDAGRACPKNYAKMARADRELKLAGYEVFRFGASELSFEASAADSVCGFFRSMFDRFCVSYNPRTASSTSAGSARSR